MGIFLIILICLLVLICIALLIRKKIENNILDRDMESFNKKDE